MKKWIGLILLIFSSCTQKDRVEVCIPMDKSKAISEMRNWVRPNNFVADSRTVVLSLGKFSSTSFPEAKDVADSALHIASVLLSSSDFKAIIAGLDFTCRNYNSRCARNCAKCSDRFNGRVVLDSIFKEKQVRLNLFLRNCSKEYGHSTFNIHEVYSCHQVVFFDEKKLSPAYCYAYHLAHEYMHIIGFFHTDHVDDVAEKAGWLGWETLLRWQQTGLNAMQMQPGEQ